MNPKRFFQVACGAILLALSTSRVPASEPEDGAAYAQMVSSVVLVEGTKRTTGFVVTRDATYTYLVTAAHVIDEGRYRDNAKAPATVDGIPNFKLSAKDFISVRVPKSGAVLPTEIIGEPDFDNDVLVARIPTPPNRLRPVCLATDLRPGSNVGLTTFGLEVLNGGLEPNVLFAQYIQRRTGDGLVPRFQHENEIEFNIAADPGYSGAPIYHSVDGLVIGAVRRSAQVITADTRTMLGVAPKSLQQALLAALGEHAVTPLGLNETSAFVPDLRQSGRLRLIRFDDRAGGEGPVPDMYAPLEPVLKGVIAERFGQKTPPFAVELVRGNFESTVPTSPLGRLSGRICDLNAVGVIAIKRRSVPVVLGRRLVARIALLDCAANVIDSTDLPPIPMNSDGSFSGNNLERFRTELQDAFERLSGPSHQRLHNFALDGIPLDDGEFRGFYRVRADTGRVFLRAGWVGAGFDTAKVQQEFEVTSVAGHIGEIATLTSDELDRIIDAAGLAGVSIISPDENAPSRLFGGDRCTTLARRRQASENALGFDTRDGINGL